MGLDVEIVYSPTTETEFIEVINSDQYSDEKLIERCLCEEGTTIVRSPDRKIAVLIVWGEA